MHVQDGILPTTVVAAGWGAAGALTAATLPALRRASPPRVAMMTSAFFVASLLAFPVGPSRVHLSLLGLCGIVLGRAAFPAVLVGVALQYALFAHGGLLTLGTNATTMGAGALCAAALYRLTARPTPLVAALAAGAGTVVSMLLYGAALLSAGEPLRPVAYAALGLNAPLVLVEAVVAGAAVRFLLRVEPSLVGVTPSLAAPGEGP